MEVTVVDTGDLPPGTIISFHTGTIRRHAQIEKNKAINLTATSSEPIRVDLMAQLGTHTFDMVPGQDVYEVPITTGDASGREVKLKVQIRNAPDKAEANEEVAAAKEGEEEQGVVPGSPVKKLQTALMMRSYLDNHDVLRQMQELLQEMVSHRPEDPIDYMIQRLEQVCRESHGVDLDVIDGEAASAGGAPALPAPAPAPASAPEAAAKKPKKEDSDSESDDDEDAPDLPPPPPPGVVKKRTSVSDEAYGAFNQRKAYEPKVIPKDDSAKARIREILQQSWMFKIHTPENMNIIIDAMSEKVVEKDVKLITQGDSGEVMWLIEEGSLECYKTIDGKQVLVKTCVRGDVFGELALLYNCPRAASVISAAHCMLWELDRETFKAICYEAAQSSEQPEYEGFTRPGGSAAAASSSAAASEEKPAEEKAADSDSDSGDDGKEPEAPKPRPVPAGKPRRQGVSAEAMNGNDTNWVPPVYPKTPEERKQLSEIIRTSHDSKMHMLFGSVSKDTFEKIVDACESKVFEQGQHVIEQGDVGDFFYIVKSGFFDIFVSKGQDPPKKVFQASTGFAFGELALLYNAPRSATITAAERSEVFALDRTAFRNLVIKSSEAQFKQRVEFLNGVDVFQVLNESERASLAEVLEEEEFADDEAIVEQGERDDKMFILLTGKAVACIKGEQGEVEVMTYATGNYFGEIALLSGEPRKASVYAVGPCTCLYIARPTFMRVLGSLSSFLERNIGRYAKYQDAISNGVTDEPAAEEQDDHGEEHEGGQQQPAAKKSVRKRERASENLENLKSTAKLEKDEAPPETLADKVAQDFKNEALVTPAAEFEVPGAQMMTFGGLVLGQKFTMDKVIHAKTAAEPEKVNDGDDKFCWNAPSKLKLGTDIGVVCQKGQKSASDPTPNQDNFFVFQKDGVTIYGVCDGHGPFGHLVSFRLVQTLPDKIAKSSYYGKDWEQALKEGFLEAQKDLCEFCKLHDINIEASGAAGSVLVLEEQTVHIAFIGDARIMLGSWNRRDSRMIFCTTDHKPELPEEKARLEENGSEVREIDPGSYRIYLPGSKFPGLTMSRAFGDTACGGVLREPEYHKFLMQPTDQWYAIVASDGVWEFLEGEEVCNLTAKKLRLKGPQETIKFLVSASRKRWNHCCGEYCDDITAVLIQWNADNKESKTNHSLTVKRPDH
eukprot:CAMPEP_0206625240 /NCGR_PEP_ID=MMETSP0325_2-20121206/64636_1 /ASSEMBLY_ACC=CAM_ASM_000347 /TAXON_ID=2866 /ORGANISM="Crypthecodinium cohnii, Strain Seligo" /LENGTH=1175 /DNA_ID=CAMNT_0054149423 /DNA_START=1 /DNA_END=3528 /DNA_ORIENTATION=-